MSTMTAPPLRTEAPATDVPRRTAALVAGAGYVAMFVLAVFANFIVVEGLVVADDPAATVEALVANRGLLRLGIVAFLGIAVLDVVVAWGLHVLLRAVEPPARSGAENPELIEKFYKQIINSFGYAYPAKTH
jgi:hypothetical protein